MTDLHRDRNMAKYGDLSPGRHERRGRHEVCGASVGAVFWGYTCDRIAGHGGSHWADDLKFNAPRGPITYPEIPSSASDDLAVTFPEPWQ
jgi:hypothetical protein